MADVYKTVKTVDIQLVDAERLAVRTYKIDNPKENLTRAMVAEAFQTALAQEWLLAGKAQIAKYIGDVTLNTSTKIILGGSDYYITPNSLTLNSPDNSGIITVSGAYIQGYNISNLQNQSGVILNNNIQVELSANGLIATVTVGFNSATTGTSTFDLILVIQGVEVPVPVTATRS